MQKKLRIIKVGGNVLNDPALLSGFIEVFGNLPGRKVLIHGGGKLATDLAQRLGLEVHFHKGRRITDEAMLDIACMVYGGLINKKLVVRLQACNCDAIGLSGADANIMRATHRSKEISDYGLVGDIHIEGTNTGYLTELLESGRVPIICSLTHDGNGQLLNTNADTIASVWAISLSRFYEVDLIYCFEKEGVLQDVNNRDTLIREMRYNDYLYLTEKGVIQNGMIPKLENAFATIRQGVRSIRILHALSIDRPHTGTTIR